MPALYQLSKEEVTDQLKTDLSGLKKEAIPALQKEYGPNALQEAKQKSRLSILLAQFTDIMIIILIVAAVISFVVGEHTDAFVIIAIIVANAWMGYSQEYNAEQSVRMLQKMSAQYALVIRNNNPSKIEAEQLVPGDIILLEAGDIVPADARLIEVSSLKTDEASLTGESHSVEKNAEPLKASGLVPGDQQNMVFKGTIVSNGSAKAVVTATGMHTEIGKIAGLMEVESQKTPLQKRLAVFSKQLAVIVILICIAVFGFGWWRGAPPFQMFLTALSLAVAALPEALPAVITIALAQGASRMVKQKALMRKLPAVETLGSVTYICSDKTGTLTQNVMTVEKLQAAPGKEDWLNYAMILDNEVRFSQEEGLLGDSTETALVKYAMEKGHSKEDADAAFPLLEKLPFDSVRMRMSTLHRHGDKWVLFVKGAPGKVTEALSSQYKAQIPQWLNTNREWAAEGLRVLFFAYKVFDQKPSNIQTDIESDLDFLGMTAMIDPPREEVIEAIKQCKTAGIKSVMITGDQPLTAHAIAKRLQLTEKGEEGVKTGAELEKLTAEQFSNEIKNTAVYARVSPEQKLNIVKALQTNGEFVAMTGDGVNDAPSLKQADIGVAMGITGTDVSKESADMILLDDNFATIVKAVREGRRIYENIKKFIVYVLSCNLGEILTIFFAPIMGFAIPLLPIHILWINLVTDGLPGLALVAEPAEKDIMNRSPRPPKENLFSGGLIPRILFTGAILAIAAIFVQWWVAKQGYDVRTQQTAVFTSLCFVQLVNALSVRSVYHSMFTGGIFANRGMWGAIILTVVLQLLIVYVPFLHSMFKTKTLSWNVMSVILFVTLGCALCIELVKYLNKPRFLNR
ncbi:cation-translocating P-type ATPase [Agriterribacter humi]|uniref:cation-translocating P-type ATPase n=1 Tax=Agriterribacter humi TaxID=1104781 RepID=UPI001264BAA9|nr:cation-translocating P-type ATPase [Agriterribacter humi]